MQIIYLYYATICVFTALKSSTLGGILCGMCLKAIFSDLILEELNPPVYPIVLLKASEWNGSSYCVDLGCSEEEILSSIYLCRFESESPERINGAARRAVGR